MSVTSVTYAQVTRRSASYTPTSTPVNALQGTCWSAAIQHIMNFEVRGVLRISGLEKGCSRASGGACSTTMSLASHSSATDFQPAPTLAKTFPAARWSEVKSHAVNFDCRGVLRVSGLESWYSRASGAA